MNILQVAISGTPFYPHWLEFRNMYAGNRKMFRYVRGKVLETGCGNGENKERILEAAGKRIVSYLATDYSSWDDIFVRYNSRVKLFGIISSYLYGKKKTKQSVDQVADALNLPFKDKTFDTYCSFEVLEHIQDPERFFSEASRVLKTGGHCIISVPYFYREHSEGTGYDYFRYTKSCLIQLGKKYHLKAVSVKTQSYFGTSMAAGVNQYVIRKIMERGYGVKIILLSASPFIFFLMNVFGYIIDMADHDERYATRFHAVFKKIS